MQDNKEFEISSADKKVGKTKKNGFFTSRGFKYGSLATALTAIIIVAVIAVNLIFSVLSDKYAWSFDITSTDLYAVSDASKQIVNSLDPETEINVTIFSAENNYPYVLSEPIKRFCNLSDKINYSYIDLEKNPAAATKYGAEYSISANSVVVESGDRVRVFDYTDYIEQQDSGSYSIYIEEKLAAGVLYVTKEDIPVIYFINGHGEEGYETLMKTLANNGAEVEQVNLSTMKEDFSPYGKVMVICQPTRDYAESEIRKIEDFLNNGNMFGRNLMVFSSADSFELPNLERFMALWGIKFGDDTVYDDENCYSIYPNMVIPEVTQEEILESGEKFESVIYPIVPNSRSIELTFSEHDIYRTQAVLYTNSDTSYSRPSSDVSNSIGKQPTDIGGSHCVAALSMKYKYESNVRVQSLLFASGSTDMISGTVLSETGNGEILMQIYKMMVNEKDDTIVSAQKSMSSTVATINATQNRIVVIITLIVMPLIFFIIGAVVFIRRRFL